MNSAYLHVDFMSFAKIFISLYDATDLFWTLYVIFYYQIGIYSGPTQWKE